MAVVVHKFIRDKYSKRFPELESLVHTPLEYIKTVQVCVDIVITLHTLFSMLCSC